MNDRKVRAKLGTERMRYVFTKKAGAIESLPFLADAFGNYDLLNHFVIEVYLPNGERRTATNREQALALLTELRSM